MRITDRIRKALSGMSAEDVDKRILEKEAEIRSLRDQIKQAEEELDAAGLTGKGEDEAAARLAALREQYRRAPDQLEKLKEAHREHRALALEKTREAERQRLADEIAKIEKSYSDMLAAVERYNKAVASSEFAGVSGLQVQRRMAGERYIAQGEVLPDLPQWRVQTLNEFDRSTANRAKTLRTAPRESEHSVLAGTAEAVHAASARAHKRAEVVAAANSGDDDARAALALGEE